MMPKSPPFLSEHFFFSINPIIVGYLFLKMKSCFFRSILQFVLLPESHCSVLYLRVVPAILYQLPCSNLWMNIVNKKLESKFRCTAFLTCGQSLQIAIERCHRLCQASLMESKTVNNVGMNWKIRFTNFGSLPTTSHDVGNSVVACCCCIDNITLYSCFVAQIVLVVTLNSPPIISVIFAQLQINSTPKLNN